MGWTQVRSPKKTKDRIIANIHYSRGVAIRKTLSKHPPFPPNINGAKVEIIPLNTILDGEDRPMQASEIRNPVLASDPSQNLMILDGSIRAGSEF